MHREAEILQQRVHRSAARKIERLPDAPGEAFGKLYDMYVDVVYRFVYFRVNDRGLAEDFTSETFLRALRRIGTVNYQGRDIGAWFVTIARNIVLDHVKSARHRLEVTTADRTVHRVWRVSRSPRHKNAPSRPRPGAKSTAGNAAPA